MVRIFKPSKHPLRSRSLFLHPQGFWVLRADAKRFPSQEEAMKCAVRLRIPAAEAERLIEKRG